jgi:hypothetical protein
MVEIDAKIEPNGDLIQMIKIGAVSKPLLRFFLGSEPRPLQNRSDRLLGQALCPEWSDEIA